MSEEITITLTDNSEEITVTLNENARGPAGSSASVTNANINAAIETDPVATREALEIPNNNFAAVAAPTINDDSGDGYSAGSKWYDTVGQEAYLCVDATVGAGVWILSTLTPDDLGSAAFLDAEIESVVSTVVKRDTDGRIKANAIQAVRSGSGTIENPYAPASISVESADGTKTTIASGSTSNRVLTTPDQDGIIAVTSDLTNLKPIVISANKAAVLGETYHNVASATYTDPSPEEGKGYRVVVLNGTATVGGTAYSTFGTIIERTWHSGSWQTNRVYLNKAQTDAIYTKKTTDLLERFDITSRWADNATITHLVTMPEVGDFPWRISTNGTPPSVRTSGLGGGLIAVDNALWYLGNKVPTPNGKMNLGFIFECVTDIRGVFNNTMNISFSKNEMLPDGGGIVPTGVVHINFSLAGISSISYFGGAGIPCVNAAFDGTNYRWNKLHPAPDGPLLSKDRNYAIILRVDGDELTITIPSVGELVFQDPGISDLIGSEYTNFWFEASGGLLDGVNYGQVVKLHRVWSSEALNYDPSYGGLIGGNIPTMGGLGISRSNATHQINEKLMSNDYPETSKHRVAGAENVALNGKNRARGGDYFTETVYTSNTDATNVGSAEFGIAPMDVDCSLTSTLSSSAGAETVLKSVIETVTLRAGDFVEWEWMGQLVGAGTKRIRIVKALFGTVFFDSTTQLDGLAGAYHLRLIQGKSDAVSHITLAILTVNGLAPIVQRVSANPGNNFWYMEFLSTSADAGGITLDLMKKEVHRVKNP